MYTMALDAFNRYQQQLGELPVVDYSNYVYKFCCTLDITYDELFAKSRKTKHVRYRCLFANWVSISMIEVSRLLDLHHSTVIHMRQSHKERLNFDKEYRRLFSILT